MKDLLLMVGVSVFAAWFLMVPLVDFVSSRTKPQPQAKPCGGVEVQRLPQPRVNYNIPCDDTDCLLEELPLQEI